MTKKKNSGVPISDITVTPSRGERELHDPRFESPAKEQEYWARIIKSQNDAIAARFAEDPSERQRFIDEGWMSPHPWRLYYARHTHGDSWQVDVLDPEGEADEDGSFGGSLGIYGDEFNMKLVAQRLTWYAEKVWRLEQELK